MFVFYDTQTLLGTKNSFKVGAFALFLGVFERHILGIGRVKGGRIRRERKRVPGYVIVGGEGGMWRSVTEIGGETKSVRPCSTWKEVLTVWVGWCDLSASLMFEFKQQR